MMTTLAQLMPAFIVPGLAAAGALAVSVPIIIHILSKRPRKPEPWAAMRFLLAAYKKHRMRTQLEQWLLLLVRCLLVLLLGFALAGPIWSAAAALAGLGGGRLVVVVLDDSLTSGAADGPGHNRFQTLKSAADRLLESLTTSDRVALVSASRPARAVVAPIADPNSVRSQLQEMQPTAAASDWVGGLRLAKKTLEESAEPARRAYVVLFSDFSAGAVRGESGEPPAMPKELADLGALATLLHVEPAAPADNVQVAELAADHKLIVAQSTGETPTAGWTVKLRRFTTADPGEAVSTIRLSLPNSPTIRRPVAWQPGQREAEILIATPLTEKGLIAAEAELEPGVEGSDSLSADNTRRALVQVRQKLTVMVVGGDEASDSPFTPRQWLITVLAPVSDRLGWPIEVAAVEPSAIGAPTVNLNTADAVIVPRPDLLTESGFSALKTWAEAGGLLWVVAPADGAASLWPQQLATAFELPWSIGQQPVDHSPALAMKTDGPAVGELSRLRTDLPDLLRPVTVSRRLAVDPATLGSATELLLSGATGEPVLIGAMTPTTRGRVLLLTTAIDPKWTNLQTKPLFVPLMHEVLRAAVDRLQPERGYHPGDQPLLPPVWDQTPKITGPDGEGVLLAEESGVGGQGKRPVRPFDKPGIYRGVTESLVVNVDSPAGDTRAADPALLTSLLNEAGAWKALNAADPASGLKAEASKADLGWPLLWAVLALALIETLLARLVSHASAARHEENVILAGARK